MGGGAKYSRRRPSRSSTEVDLKKDSDRKKRDAMENANGKAVGRGRGAEG